MSSGSFDDDDNLNGNEGITTTTLNPSALGQGVGVPVVDAAAAVDSPPPGPVTHSNNTAQLEDLIKLHCFMTEQYEWQTSTSL